MNNYIIISPARCGTSWVQETIQRTLGYTSLPDLILENIDFPKSIINAQSPWVAKLFTDEYCKFNVPINWWFQFGNPIYMYRSNIVDHFLSFAFATKTTIFNSQTKLKYNNIMITNEDFKLYENIWKNFIKIKPQGIILKYETMFSDICQLVPENYNRSTFTKLLKYSEKIKLINLPIKNIEYELKLITKVKDLYNFIW